MKKARHNTMQQAWDVGSLSHFDISKVLLFSAAQALAHSSHS
jgi:hypothetical protein